jgi:NOL1/NOP2/fmu family ribosome biogenesis protein/precorrin-6B methylase 2
MCAAPLLEVKPGEKVLDLCSAPGGKGTQLACRMSGQGVILLNEPIASRAKILSQNVERMGIKNAVVCNEYPDALAARFQGYFDKILVDAPCSGEGMFRKNAEEALGEWSEENVLLCAERQSRILHEAEKMLKKGGKMVYSTCTFAPQEDERQVENFVKTHPNMRLIRQEKLYPHRVKGEGHFVALLEKTDGEDKEQRVYKGKCSLQTEKLYREFEKKVFAYPQAKYLHEINGVLYALPEGVFDWKDLHVLRVGVKLGEVKNGRFEPNHALAMSVKMDELNAVCNLTDEREIEKYLRGETLEKDGNGWVVVCVNGYPVGWGKLAGGTLKNHLPKGLRMSLIEW